MRRQKDSNFRIPFEIDALAERWFQPLTHTSIVSLKDSFERFHLYFNYRLFKVVTLIHNRSGIKHYL